MRSLLLVGLVAASAFCAPPALVRGDNSNPTIAGHWDGHIALPGTKLGIKIDLESNEDALQGTIDIPVQGLRGFKLGDLSQDGKKVSFTLEGIPGDPKFQGECSEDGKKISGDFTQSGATFPFELNRGKRTEKEGETPSKGVPGEGLAGAWQGSLQVQAFQLRILMKIKEDGDTLTGTMDSLDQNALNIPINAISLDDKTVKLEIKKIGGSYEGKLSDDGSEIVGTWKQGGTNVDLTMRRLEKTPDTSRPQDPKPPFPYESIDVTFKNQGADISLAGTLTLPKSKGPHPAVVMITGSGPQDRDEAIMGHRPFLVWADHLTRAGIAVLRYDDRGVGKSEGRFSKATVTDLESDAQAAFDFLRTREEIDANRVGLVGHSEGGILAPQIASKDDDVAFIVMLAGVGVPMKQLLTQQGTDILKVMGADQEALDRQRETQTKIFDLVLQQGDASDLQEQIKAIINDAIEQLPKDQREAAEKMGQSADQQVKMVTSPWFRELLAIDPAPALKKVACPVLAICGKKDLQVACDDNLAGIKASVLSGGNEQVTVVPLEDLNHLLQTAETGAVSEYGTIEETIAPIALKTVGDWITKQVAID